MRLLISFNTATGNSKCPEVLILPICYLVFIGYFLMLISLFDIRRSLRGRYFKLGWMIVMSIALIGTLSGMSEKGACPSSDTGFPFCTIALDHRLRHHGEINHQGLKQTNLIDEITTN